MGGGGFSMEPDNPLLDTFVLSLARSPHPRVCFLPTASGDAEGYVARFYRAFAALDCRPTDLQLFARTVGDLERFVLEQDVVYVGDGAALVFAGTELEEVVASRPQAGAYRVDRTTGDGVSERALPARYLAE